MKPCHHCGAEVEEKSIKLIRCQCGEMVEDVGNSHYDEAGNWLHYHTEREGGDRIDAAGQDLTAPGSGARTDAPLPDEPRLIVLPWDKIAQCNHRLVPKANGKGLTLSSGYRKALGAARRHVAVQAGAQGWATLTGPVERTIEVYPPDRRKRDGTNLAKMIDDALAGTKDLPGIIADDSQIVRWHGHIHPPDSESPRVVITVRALADERRGAA